jgi:hypothetical protein
MGWASEMVWTLKRDILCPGWGRCLNCSAHSLMSVLTELMTANIVLSLIPARKREVLERTNRLISFNTTRTAYKNKRPNFFYCCVCIRCHCDIFTEPLFRKDKRLHSQTVGRDL